MVKWLGAVACACLLCAALAGCGSGGSPAASTPAPQPAPQPAAEIVVRTPAALRTPGDMAALMQAAARQGVQAVHLLVKQDEDGALESGQTFYPSRIAPTAQGYEGFDVLQAALDAAHPLKLRVHAWIPQFHDQVAARRNPTWAMRRIVNGQVQVYQGTRNPEYFVNPLDAQVQAYERAIVQEVVARYAVDGVMLDWIRFDDYPMDVGEATRAAFRAETGLDALAIDFTHDSAERRRWNEFRTAGIAAYVRTLRAVVPARLPMGVFILPPEFVEVGQDAARFNTDASPLAPMCYYLDWGFAIEWLWTNCMPSTTAKAGSAEVMPTLDAKLPDAELRRILARLRVDQPQIRRIAWFAHEAWTEDMMARLVRLSREP